MNKEKSQLVHQKLKVICLGIDKGLDRKFRKTALKLLEKHPDWTKKEVGEEAIKKLIERGEINEQEIE